MLQSTATGGLGMRATLL